MALKFQIEHFPRPDIFDCISGSIQQSANAEIVGMAHGRILCSPHAHAVIRGIDVTKALALPGVVAILTAADCQDGGTRTTIDGTHPAPIFARKARFVGDWIAAVAAESSIVAEEALELIDVDYVVLPPILDPLLAAGPDGPLVHDDVPGNIAADTLHPLTNGSVKEVFAEAAFVGEFSGVASRKLRSDFQQQTAVAMVSGNGVMTVSTSAHYSSDLDPGARSIETVAALLANACGRPVKVMEPDALTLYSPHTSSFHSVTIAADDKGVLCGLDHIAIADAGAYSLEHFAVGNVAELPGMLHCGAIGGRIASIYTNTPPAGGSASSGKLEGNFIFQQAIDRLSEKAGIDPLSFRIRNLLSGEAGARMERCMRLAADRFGWQEKWHGWRREGASGGRYRQGAGMSILTRSTGKFNFGHQADFVEVEVDTETGFTVLLKHVCAIDVTGFRGLPDPVLLQASLMSGIGIAMIESFIIDPQIGCVPEDVAFALRAPNIMDAPDIDYIFTGVPLPPEIEEGHDPLQLGFSDPAPAIANAVYNATGIRIHSLPLSADKILLALHNADVNVSARSMIRGQYL